MKKKIIVLMLAGMMALSSTACGESSSSQNVQKEDSSAASISESTSSDESSTDNDSSTETVAKDLPDGNYQDMGSGTMYLATSGGTSENGEVPVVYASSEDLLIQIELDTFDFDGSKLSYIYIDGMLYSKEQLGETQMPIDLSEDSLKTGAHKVEVLQYSNDDSSSDVVTYKTASYEIKEK